jgi:hypothetical protein
MGVWGGGGVRYLWKIVQQDVKIFRKLPNGILTQKSKTKDIWSLKGERNLRGYAFEFHFHVYAACPRLCCMSTSLLHVHVCAACPRLCSMFRSMLHVHAYAACSRLCCMSPSMLHVQVYAACPRPCWMSMSLLHVHVHAACPYPCCMSMVMLQVHVVLNMDMDTNTERETGIVKFSATFFLCCEKG